MADDSGWGDALTLTIRALYLNPRLPWMLHCGTIDVLTDEQIEAVKRWRGEAARLLGRSRHLDEQLDALLDSAARWLESGQGELAATYACRTSCPEFRWKRMPQSDRDLYAAVMALSRTAGPEVMLTDRVAVDLIESMTGRRYVSGNGRRQQPWITRPKRRLESRGYVTIGFMPGSRTTLYRAVQQGTYAPHPHKCPVALAGGTAGPDSRPVLSEQDWQVFMLSRVERRNGAVWEPGKALAAVRELAAAEMRRAEQQEASAAAVNAELDELLDGSPGPACGPPPEPGITIDELLGEERHADEPGAGRG